MKRIDVIHDPVKSKDSLIDTINGVIQTMKDYEIDMKSFETNEMYRDKVTMDILLMNHNVILFKDNMR